MSTFRLFKHRCYDRSVELLPPAIQRKATWSQVLLGTRGRTPNVKSTSGYNARWRRTPVQGYHYYLWWIPLSESGLTGEAASAEPGRTILVHSIRHHDETDDPIDLRSLDEFEEVRLANLDPRFDEQRAVGDRLRREPLSLAAVKGLPGSGKTVALFYLVRDLAERGDLANILYVTYTSRLKRAAREFLEAQEFAGVEHVRIRTYNEAVGDILGSAAPHFDPFGDLRDFISYLELQKPSTLGAWKRYPQTLYTELRAYLFGRTLPAGYALPKGAGARVFFEGGAFDAATYGAARDLEPLQAEQAYRLAERLRSGRFFLDQRSAAQALHLLAHGKTPSWVRNLDALIVDEVQDLTPIQIALLGEVARTRMRRRGDAPLVVAVAGDESQIVQPSGFDWGVTKDLLRDQLGANPLEFEFRHQRRSPHNLAQLIDNAWSLYGHLPKQLRPSANRQTFVDDAGVDLAHSTEHAADDENGRILICSLPDAIRAGDSAGRRRWQELAAELANLPGRVIVDLTEMLAVSLRGDTDPKTDLKTDAGAKADEVIYLAREIKGLERNTVLVHGLNETYQKAVRLTGSAHDDLPRLEARRLFDEIRVALSRSTARLVLLEAPGAAVLDELEVHRLGGRHVIDWDSLLEILKTEEMSEIEVVEGYLDEADELLERGRWEQARRRNRRAYDFAVQLEDRALMREAQEQLIRSYLQESTAASGIDCLQEACVLNRQAFELAEAHGDPQVLDEVEEQRIALEQMAARRVALRVDEAATLAEAGDLASAYRAVLTAVDIPAVTRTPAIQSTIDERVVEYGWLWGLQLAAGARPDGDTLAALFQELGAAMHRQSDVAGAQLAAVIAERYRTTPGAATLNEVQIGRLLRYVDHYLETVAPLSLDTSAFLFADAWLEEAYASLADHRSRYYEWAILAQTYATMVDYPPLDERLWDLENRIELVAGADWQTASGDEHLVKFAAFIAAYKGDAAVASHAWEKLGQIDLAAIQARTAGDVERAYNLLRRSNAPIPEELSIAVKLSRLVEQLQSKQARLKPAEREMLADRLDRFVTVLRTAGEGTMDKGQEA